ncbi:hypothetical protein [Corynebacterium atypicum]|uniref:hypothetical protein n=1 Tax=Corynebacterium atypicum TaxID=191610 RepID=UPI00068D5ABF|nr:hypothetical protein [Corynebacterium atypicum]
MYNIDLRQGARRDFSDHVAMLYSPRVAGLVAAALEAPEGTRLHADVDSVVLPWVGALPRWRRRRDSASSAPDAQ